MKKTAKSEVTASGAPGFRPFDVVVEAALTPEVLAREEGTLSPLSVVEVIDLVEKGKLPPAYLPALVTTLTDPAEAMALLPIEFGVTQAVHQVPGNRVPVLPDRLSAARALAHRLPWVTSDAKIRVAPLPTIA